MYSSLLDLLIEPSHSPTCSAPFHENFHNLPIKNDLSLNPNKITSLISVILSLFIIIVSLLDWTGTVPNL